MAANSGGGGDRGSSALAWSVGRVVLLEADNDSKDNSNNDGNDVDNADDGSKDENGSSGVIGALSGSC